MKEARSMPRTKPKTTARTVRRRRNRELLRKHRAAETAPKAETQAKPEGA
jgi:hypothetical protein